MWHAMVGEQGGQAVEQHGGSTRLGGIEEFPDPLDLWRRLVQRAALERVHTRSEVLDHDLLGAGHVDEETFRLATDLLDESSTAQASCS